LNSIKVNGHDFQAKTNLEKALRRFRKEKLHQVLWVDAICINQIDMAERSKQVPIMGQIYKSCRECALWLGEVEEGPTTPMKLPETWRKAEIDYLDELLSDSNITESPEPLQRAGKHGDASIDVEGAFEVMELLASHKHLHEMPFYTIPPTGTYRIPPPGTAFELSGVWAHAVYSLENILRRPWWQRIWTVQEALLPERCSLHIGPHRAPFSIFVEGTDEWNKHQWKHCCSSLTNLWIGYTSEHFKLAVERIMELNSLRSRDWTTKGSVAHNMYLLSIHRNATLPHDQVYGLFGLITEFFRIDDRPDYNLGLGQVFAATTNRFMESAKHLCLLPYARPQLRELSKDEPGKAFLQELPSWCPDWSAKAWGDYFDIYNYGGFSADTMLDYDGSRQKDTILRLEGIRVENIGLVGELIPNMKAPPAETTPIIEQWLGFMAQRDVGPRALWELIHVATHQDVGLDKVDLQEDYWKLVKSLAEKNVSYQELKDASVLEKHQFCRDSMEWLDKRAIYVTDPDPSNVSSASKFRAACPKGTVGMALPFCRQGDAIFIVKGGRTPLIFRRLSDLELRERALKNGIPEDQLSRCYTYVGVSYIHGLMQGQGVAEEQHWEHVYLL
jgi:Heterokaryon incompatibility protein (HET)